MDFMTDEMSCIVAVATIPGLSFTTALYSETAPSGCFYYANGTHANQAYFNRQEASTTPCSASVACLCASAETAGPRVLLRLKRGGGYVGRSSDGSGPFSMDLFGTHQQNRIMYTGENQHIVAQVQMQVDSSWILASAAAGDMLEENQNKRCLHGFHDG